MVNRIEVTGLPVDAVTIAQLIDEVGSLLESGANHNVGYLNVHVANEARKHPILKQFIKGASIVYCDGSGIKLAAKILGRELPERMTGADWIWELADRAAAEGWKIYWFGGEEGVTHLAAEVLREGRPNLKIETDHGFHKDDALKSAIERINAFEPHIVLVGMGSPVQEEWVTRWRSEINAPVVWCLGATADFISGKTNRGPEWLYTRAEWLARLVTEPRRLAHRYLVGNTVFLGRVLWERIRRS
jgi:N-acetylglucosaminyldiphosphoundecaprenol N-acetyl-beta-D-mannosaminyltransferase